VERVLPRGAVAVVVVPSVAVLGQRLVALEPLKVLAFLAPTQGFSDARAFTDAAMSQLGVDLRRPEALEAAGLDGQGSLGLALLVSAEAFLAVPVKDPKKFQAALAVLAQSRLGAGAAQEQTLEGVAVRTFAPSSGGKPVLGYVLTRGYALVASGAALARLPGLATLGESDALSADRDLASQRGRAPASPDVYAWAPRGSPLLAQLPVTQALATGRLDASGLLLELDAPWKPGAAEAAALEARPGAELQAPLPADAFLTARYRGDPALGVDPLLAVLGGALQAAGADLKTELLPALAPGAVAGLSLAPRPPLDRGLAGLDPRSSNPFASLHLSGAAALGSADAGVAALERLAVAAPRFGARLERGERGGVPVFLTTWAQGEGVHFAVQGDRLLFGSPLARLDALLAADGGVDGPPGDGALSVRLSMRRLAAAVRALPESAWGLGGFALKGTAVRWLDAVDDLTALDVQVGSRDGALRGRLALELQLGPARPGP
jgi:hypothetical protein